MPYFPTEQESAYFCPNCQKWYTRATMSCLVNHAPGSCCHEYERQVNGPVPDPGGRTPWPDSLELHITGSDQPYAFGFSGFNEADRQQLVPDVPMAEIDAAIEKDGKFEHPTKPIRIMRTRDF